MFTYIYLFIIYATCFNFKVIIMVELLNSRLLQKRCCNRVSGNKIMIFDVKKPTYLEKTLQIHYKYLLQKNTFAK